MNKNMDKNTTMTVQEAATLLGVRLQTLRKALEDGAVPWGVCIRTSKYRKRYIIYRERFETETGIKTNQHERRPE